MRGSKMTTLTGFQCTNTFETVILKEHNFLDKNKAKQQIIAKSIGTTSLIDGNFDYPLTESSVRGRKKYGADTIKHISS